MGLGEKDSVLSDNADILFDDEVIVSNDSVFGNDSVLSNDSILSNDSVFSDDSLITKEERDEVYRLIEEKKAEIERKERELRRKEELRKAEIERKEQKLKKSEIERKEKELKKSEETQKRQVKPEKFDYIEEDIDGIKNEPKGKSLFEHTKSDGIPSYITQANKDSKNYRNYKNRSYSKDPYYSKNELSDKLLPLIGVLLLCLVLLIIPMQRGFVKAMVELIILIVWFNYKRKH